MSEEDSFDFDTVSSEEAVERIMLLEASNVGCDSHCQCRALVAMMLSKEQAATLKEHAARVTFGKARSNEQVVKKVLDLEGVPGEYMDQIKTDRGGKSREKITGGREIARQVVDFLIAEASLQDQIYASGAEDSTTVH